MKQCFELEYNFEPIALVEIDWDYSTDTMKDIREMLSYYQDPAATAEMTDKEAVKQWLQDAGVFIVQEGCEPCRYGHDEGWVPDLQAIGITFKEVNFSLTRDEIEVKEMGGVP